jgi:hypothetical protein
MLRTMVRIKISLFLSSAQVKNGGAIPPFPIGHHGIMVT